MAHVALEEREVAGHLQGSTASTENAKTCVLLIEDSEEAMFLVRCALDEHGDGVYQLEWKDGLTSGLERLGKGGVDVVLLDLGLPDSSGADSYAMVRKMAPQIPILVLTGDTREATESAVAARGVQDFLVKDQISGSLLMQAIRAALHTSKRHDIERFRLANSASRAAAPTPARHRLV